VTLKGTGRGGVTVYKGRGVKRKQSVDFRLLKREELREVRKIGNWRRPYIKQKILSVVLTSKRRMESIRKCEALVTDAQIFENVKLYLEKNQENYAWCVSKHGEQRESTCHEVKGVHHHWIIWWRSNAIFSNTALVSFLKRQGRKLGQKTRNDGKIYAHQKVRKLESLLTYMQAEGREMLWGESNCAEEIRAMADNISEQARKRMNEYIAKRDAGKHVFRPPSVDETDLARSVDASIGPKVNLQSIIDMVIDDGCSSFDEWQREVFKLHKEHDAFPRQALIKVLGHPRGDALIRACENYMKNHVMSMDWKTSLEYRKPLIQLDEEDGKYYPVSVSKNWVRRICRHNNWSVTKFVSDVVEIMQKQNQKVNCLFFQGPSNAGKSTLATSIRDGFLSVGNVTRSDTFLFQDCVDRQLIFQEECIIKPSTVDDWKRMMEGAQMKVDIKNRDPKNVSRTPVLVCSNALPWDLVQNEHDPLKNRMKLYKLKSMPSLKEKTKDLNPLLWLSFLEDLGEESDQGSDVDERRQSPISNRKRSRPTTPEEWLNDDVDAIIANLDEPPQKRIQLETPMGGTLPDCDPFEEPNMEELYEKWQTQPCTSQEIQDFNDDMGALERNRNKQKGTQEFTVGQSMDDRFKVDDDIMEMFFPNWEGNNGHGCNGDCDDCNM
jgi:hypothetical protein